VDAEKRRGYLSNVCVAPEVRKQGVGAALLQRAQEVAHLWGTFSLYLSLLLVLTRSLLLSDTKLNVEKPKCLSFSMSVQRFCHRKKIYGCRGNRSYWDSQQIFLG